MTGTPKECYNLPILYIGICVGNSVDCLPSNRNAKGFISHYPGEELLANISYQIAKVIYKYNPAL